MVLFFILFLPSVLILEASDSICLIGSSIRLIRSFQFVCYVCVNPFEVWAGCFIARVAVEYLEKRKTGQKLSY